jgi:hypothetical protein
MLRLLAVAMLTVASVAVPKSCTLGTGSGSGSSGGSSVSLGVPFFTQSANYCGPASIEMWSAYDGVFATQQQIASYIGCSTATGSSPAQILEGVLRFTTSGRDSVIAYNSGGVFYSAEVTSANARVPIICLVNGALHSGVIDGGEWHVDSDTGLYVWDTVYFHDPEVGPDQPYFAASWTGTDNVEHIISGGASANAQANYGTYGSRVMLRGSGGGVQRLPY